MPEAPPSPDSESPNFESPDADPSEPSPFAQSRLDRLSRPPAPVPLRERLARLGDAVGFDLSPVRVTLALIAVGALAGLAYVLLRPPPPSTPETSLPFDDGAAASSTAEAAGESTTTVMTTVLAHAAGAVVSPGVYRLASGSRVADLVAAAGGAAPDADLDRVNLAAVLTDGEQIYVPHIGQVGSGGAEGPSPGGATGSDGGAGGQTVAPIDVNTASVDELDSLPGIGPAIAQAIVTYREDNGEFSSVDELLEVPGIGDAKLEQLRGLVSV